MSDPLEELKALVYEPPLEPHHVPLRVRDDAKVATKAHVRAAIAAWEKERAGAVAEIAHLENLMEKERAGWAEAHRQVFEAQQADHAALCALRTAVEKVRDEMRGHVKAMHDQYGAPLENQIVGEWSDALDAALGGGA